MTRQPRRRATVYVAVLGVALVVATIGISALVLARGQLRLSTMNESAVKADFYAQSTLDLATFRFATLPWRTTYSHDTWVSSFNLAGATLSVKLVDELDGDLANDANQPVRLYGRAVCGDAVRIYSVRLQPRTPTNLLANGDFESGTANWSPQSCALQARTDLPHGGTTYLYVYNRLVSYGAPIQALATPLRNGATYRFEGWARMSSGTYYVRPVLKIVSTADGTIYFAGGNTIVGTSWTWLSTTLTPTWGGTVTAASLYVDTSSGTTPFSLDDLKLIDTDEPTLVPVSGTCRREVSP